MEEKCPYFEIRYGILQFCDLTGGRCSKDGEYEFCDIYWDENQEI